MGRGTVPNRSVIGLLVVCLTGVGVRVTCIDLEELFCPSGEFYVHRLTTTVFPFFSTLGTVGTLGSVHNRTTEGKAKQHTPIIVTGDLWI